MRLLCWANVALCLAFVCENFLIFQGGLAPSGLGLSGDFSWQPASFLPLFPYLVAGVFCVWRSQRAGGLRADGEAIQGIGFWTVRAAFWAVLLVGLGDGLVSFLRVERLLPDLFSKPVVDLLSLSAGRGSYVHFPLILAGCVLASLTRTLGFHWLALFVVIAEILIVFSRFIFSYELALQGDLVRFWYGGLFLFSSAYTLHTDGHVRVDVLYASMTRKTKSLVNGIGSAVLGIPLCWIVLIIGMGQKSSIINAPLLSFEITQSNSGMFVKYLLAGFLGVFAVTMLTQFSALICTSMADWREAPLEPDEEGVAEADRQQVPS